MAEISKEEFYEMCQAICPHCRNGNTVIQRTDTLEFVHNNVKGSQFSHTICWASGLRNSRFAPK